MENYITSPTGVKYTLEDAGNGKCCHKGVPGCLCAVGRNKDQMCSMCSYGRAEDDIFSYCVCGPK